MSVLPFPKHPSKRQRNDAKVRIWLGELWPDYKPPLMWWDKYHEMLEPPKSVTFPICEGCGHVIWDWPHFEEQVPDHAICEECFKEDEALP